MNIRQRIFIPMITLAIVSSTAVFITSIVFYSRNLTNAAYHRLDVTTAAVEHEINSFKQSSRAAAILLAENLELKEAIKNKDRMRIIQKASELQRIVQMDFCTVTDNEGIVLARTHEPDTYGDSLSYQVNIMAALNGNIETIIEHGMVVRLSVRTGVPVKDEDGNIFGVISLGYRLDTQDLVYSFKNITNSEISIFLGDERISTTLIGEDGTFALGTKLDSRISEKVLDRHFYTGKNKVLGKNILFKYSPLYKIRYEVVGIIGVGEYTEEDEKKIFSFIINSFLITLGVLAVCVFLGFYITRSVDRQLGYAIDVMQEAIQERKELSYLLNILNGLDAMIYVTDIKTDEILFINDSMKKHYGIEGDPIGKICYKILQNGIDKRCDFCPCYQLDDNPYKPVIWEEHSTKTNRIYRNVDRYIPWLNGQMVHIQHCVDMTELITAKEFAEQSSRYKTAFLANMSHEVRTPMNAILGIAEIQLRDVNIPPAIEEAFTKIHESGDLLLHIINDILDLSKIEAGKLELISIKYDVPSLINDTIQINLLRYESKPISFKLNIDINTPLTLYGDELRLKQVLNNVLSNAFKYTDSGEVVLSVSAEYPENEEKTAILVFNVRDTGHGMNKEQVEKLFDEYTRFNLEANRTTIGTGLGMTITKQLLNLMHGSISVQSELGKGSVFIIKVPQQRIGSAVCGAELAEKLSNFTFHSTSLGKKSQFMREYMPYGSVLIVDDVESNIYVAKGMLTAYGLKIDTAISGFEAIEKIKNGSTYDVIFMDHMMPKMDGIEAVKIIREMGYNRTIVALTANALVGQAGMFLKNGFNGYISKPIDSRELNHILNDYIRNKQPPDVIHKARKEKALRNDINENKTANKEVKKYFIHDAEKAINILNNMFEQPHELNDSEIDLFVIVVHGIKSALANVSESQLFNTAFTLEKAGREKNQKLMSDETPLFIKELQALVTSYKIKLEENIKEEDLSEIDISILHDKLLEIKDACLALNKKTAKEALKSLKEKIWPQRINEVLEGLSVLLLHSAFEEIVFKTEECMRSIE